MRSESNLGRIDSEPRLAEKFIRFDRVLGETSRMISEMTEIGRRRESFLRFFQDTRKIPISSRGRGRGRGRGREREREREREKRAETCLKRTSC